VYLSVAGCGPTVEEQREWVDRLFLTQGRMENALDPAAGGRIVSPAQLEDVLGRPDFMLGAEDLRMRLPGRTEEEKRHRQRVLERVVQEYCMTKGLLTDPKDPAKFPADPAFLECQFWLYDETKHFPHELPFPVLFGPPEGFHCGFFLIEADRVVGSFVLDNWRPLRDK
jgi:hypothetical protein